MLDASNYDIERPLQQPDQVVDVSRWEPVEGYDVYPEGSRDKRLLRCPARAPYPFLKPGHKYLLKYSRNRYPAQFWCEVIAYRLGRLLGLPVPPAHVAVDSTGRPAALIEWFLERDDERMEFKFAGGEFLQHVEPEFEREKGRRHSWALVKQVFGGAVTIAPELASIPEWQRIWLDMMAFDALIGNTDRHQENWMVCVEISLGDRGQWNERWALGPFFDNGTSLGHELTEERVAGMSDADVYAYFRKGRAHLRWEGESSRGEPHFRLLDRLLAELPGERGILDRYAGVSSEDIRGLLGELRIFPVPVSLSDARVEFLARLIDFRRQELLRSYDAPC